MRKVKILSACMLLAFGLTAHAGQGTSNELTPKEKMEKALTKNIEVVGYDDLNKKSGFQMAMYKSGSKYSAAGDPGYTDCLCKSANRFKVP